MLARDLGAKAHEALAELGAAALWSNPGELLPEELRRAAARGPAGAEMGLQRISWRAAS